MSGGDDPKMKVTQYFASLHFGICHGPAELRQIFIQDKQAWAGGLSTLITSSINKPDLFGGKKKEGGAVGMFTYLPGHPDQVMPEGLANRYGRTAATCPAGRGVATIFFHTSLEDDGYAGFYWTANSPFLPGVWTQVARDAEGLTGGGCARIYHKYLYSEIINLDGEDNAASTDLGGLGAGKTINVDSAGYQLVFSLPAGQTYAGYSVWGVPSPADADGHTGSHAKFRVLRNGNAADVSAFGNSGVHDGYEAARQSFGQGAISGGTQYTFYIQDTPTFDNTGGLSIQVDVYSGPIMTNGYYAPENITSFIDPFDVNPAHIIYECLTNVQWGMGAPASAIDVPSFQYASIVLCNERFGLSMIWTQQTTIEAFISEVLDHINATLFVSPRTGKLTLKLIRGDYSLSGLAEFTPDNSVVTKFSRKLWGETINEIVVTWTNPSNEEEMTVVAQDDANISIQGGIISDGRNYYGVRRSDLAMELAQRDLRSASIPFASCDIEVSREGWDLLPGDVCILNSPEDGIESIVMRVGQVEYGKPGDPTVRASLMEDVFSLGIAEYTNPQESLAEDPSEEPSPADYTLVFTLPYYFTVNKISPATLASVEYPEVFAGILAAEEGEDTDEFELYGYVVDSLGNNVLANIGTKMVTGHSVLPEALVPEVETVIPSMFGPTERTQGNGPSVGGFMLIEGADETEHELCIITAVTLSPASITVSRGVLDTIPRSWPIDTPVWFIDESLIFVDSTIRSEAENVDYYIQPRTSLGVLALGAAPVVEQTLTGRPHYPSRPAAVTVDLEDGFSGMVDMTGVDPIPVNWARRNRVTEDSIVLAWNDSDVSPEAGQTTTVRLTDLAGAVLHEYTGIAGTSQDVDRADFAGEEEGYIIVTAVRDGLESLQPYRVHILVSRDFEFEDGETYEFEDGTQNEFED